ncbi:MAG: TonB-dependent siderophore receptor [Gammaproteobacteria bacterium]|jgi:catecholate siderophore receptor
MKIPGSIENSDSLAPPFSRAASTEISLQPLARSISRILLGTGISLSLTPLVVAQDAAQSAPSTPSAAESAALEEIVVRQRQRERYVVDDSSLSKLTESLRDTPQSITTLSGEILDDRGVTSLDDALRTVPGITLGAGEFSWQGNNPNIRGFNGRDDMYLDGIRDFGSYPRDPFNLEAVEVLLGPSSVLFGRGSTGGVINQVNKRPTLEPITRFSVNAGSDNTLRGTADIDRPVPLLGDGAAFRLNLLAHRGEVADRDGAEARRYGLAPSVSFGLGTDTQLTLSYIRQSSDDRPDYGLPWLDGTPAPVSRENFYGFESDYLETDADIATLELNHEIAERTAFFSQFRYAEYERHSRITEPLLMDPPGTPLAERSVFRYVFIGDSNETLLTGQAGATLTLRGERIEHAIVTGLELSRETSAPQFAFGIGAPSTSLISPTPSDAFTATNTDPRVQADTIGETTALYLLDTIRLGGPWQITLGARWDQFRTDYTATRYAGPPTPFNAGDAAGTETFGQTDRQISYRAAVVYKPAEAMSLYLAGSTSFNPSAQSLSFLSTGRGLGTSNVFLDPEKNRSVEFGFKSGLRDDAVMLTTAIFETTKTNARVPDTQNPGFNTLGGELRVRGFSFDAVGAVTDRLHISAGYTYLDSEVVRAAPGTAVGASLANAPEHSISVWTDFLVTPRFDLGAGARYVSEQLAANTGNGKSVPAYSLFDAMGRYRLNDTLTVKFNLTNIGDEVYFAQLHPWHVVPGPGFTATAAVNVAY